MVVRHVIRTVEVIRSAGTFRMDIVSLQWEDVRHRRPQFRLVIDTILFPLPPKKENVVLFFNWWPET